MDEQEALANLVAITGADEAQALALLQATDFQLEQAVNLYFASGGGEGGGGGIGTVEEQAPNLIEDEEGDKALARRLQAESAVPAEEEVRAPIPTRMERLYGDDGGYYAQARARRPANPVPQSVVDAFRDFRAEADGTSSAAVGGNLASMFEPPRELLYQGSFQDAKQAAQEQGRWLLLNLQSSQQFASHQLNRDTWRNEMVSSLLQNNFVFYQGYDVVEDAQKLAHYYKVFELPAILVIDPVTGASMRQWTGFMDAERMVEELLPFLETSFQDPGAARLAAGGKRRRGTEATRQASQPLSEDEEVRRAIEASLQDAAGSAAAAAPAAGQRQQQQQPQPQAEQEAPAAAPAAKPAAQVAAEAAARLPPQLEGAEGCRIAVRLPDGRRAQRRFPRSAPLEAVYDYCLTVSEEAAAGRPFNLAETLPGAPNLTKRQGSIQETGVADSMLALRWAD